MSIKVTIKPFTFSDISHLSEKWLCLEEYSDCTMFLSWQWIKPWLDSLTQPAFLVEARFEGRVVGLGLFIEKKRFAFGLVPVTQWWLHRTGDQQHDQIWMEYNDFLLSKEDAPAIRSAMIKHLYEQRNRYDECIIGLSTAEVLSEYEACFCHYKSVVNDKGYLIDLSFIKDSYSSDCLSRNTRQQLNRTEKLLSEKGDLTLQIIKNTKEKKANIDKIKQLHITRWGGSDTPSGFLNPIFDEVFTKIYASEIVELVCVSLNDIQVAFLVNFIYKGKVYFYLSALEKYNDKKIKLGMIAHKKAIEYYAKQGMVSYDFLAGDSQYKKSLSNHSYMHDMKCFYIPSITLFFEQKIKIKILKLLNLVKNL